MNGPISGAGSLPASSPMLGSATIRSRGDENLGPMIHSVYAGADDHRLAATVEPIFFDARVEHGRLDVPPLPAGRR